MPKKLTYEEIVERAWSSHPKDKDKYGYLNEYPGRHKDWKIYCYRCNEWFLQNAGNHIKGAGCKKCRYVKLRELFSFDLLKFSEKANKVHINLYNYSKGIYINSSTKIEIVCSTHGSFWQKPNDHINGHGCPTCAKENNRRPRIPLFEVLKGAEKVHNGKYGYSWIDTVGYSSKGSKVPIICPDHGIFYQSLEIHCNGAGCPSCANHGFDPTKPAILYYLKEISTGLYKIGITNNSVEKRFAGKFKDLRIIKIWNYEIGFNARDRESELHKEHKEYRLLNENWVTGRGSNGAKEFFSRDVLKLDNEI